MKLLDTSFPFARSFRRARALRATFAIVVLFATCGAFYPTKHIAPNTPMYSTLPPMMDALDDRPLHLAPATTSPFATPAELMSARLAPREVFAFAPYWTLDVQSTFDLRHVTTVAYFGVDVAKDGSIEHKGDGWIGYQSQALVDLISRAHKAGVRAVLTIKAFDQDTIHALATDPNAAAAFARNVIAATKAKSFDGVNIDFEGFGNEDRARFTAFVQSLSAALHAADPAWQVTIDTYVTSANVSDGFFDIHGIAPAVDSFFVMGYDMYQREVASPNAPLPSYQASIANYVDQAPASKIVLGSPFYGYDWPTASNAPHAQSTGAPTPVTYAEIVAAGHPRYWDEGASVPWTAYQTGGQWHEIYYDDASSIALKARMADRAHLRGTGAWALGMNGDDAGLVAALLGTLTKIIGGPSGPVVATAAAPAPKPDRSPVARHPGTTSSTAPKPKPSASSSAQPSPSPSSSPLPLPIPTL